MILNRILCEKNNISAYKVMLRKRNSLFCCGAGSSGKSISGRGERVDRKNEGLDYTRVIG